MTFPYHAITELANALQSRKVDEFNFNVRLEKWILHNFLRDAWIWCCNNYLSLSRWKFFDQFDAQHWCRSNVENSLVLETSAWIVISPAEEIPAKMRRFDGKIFELQHTVHSKLHLNYRAKYNDPTILMANVSDNLLSMLSWMRL